jgi:hypothetical protein
MKLSSVEELYYTLYEKCGHKTKFESLLGKTLESVEILDSTAIYFVCSDGEEFVQLHTQEEGEGVDIEDICGDIQQLIGSPIIRAEESYEDLPAKPEDTWPFDSCTWTFYRLENAKGVFVTIRWYGVSNGYYSESVDLYKIK